MKNWKEGETDVQACRVNRWRRDKKIIVHTFMFFYAIVYWWWRRNSLWNGFYRDVFWHLPPLHTQFPHLLPMTLHFKTCKVPTQLFFYLESRKFLPVFASPIPRLFLKLLVFQKRMGAMCWAVTVAGVSGSLYPFRINLIF